MGNTNCNLNCILAFSDELVHMITDLNESIENVDNKCNISLNKYGIIKSSFLDKLVNNQTIDLDKDDNVINSYMHYKITNYMDIE